MRPIFSGSFVENDVQFRGSYGSSTPCSDFVRGLHEGIDLVRLPVKMQRTQFHKKDLYLVAFLWKMICNFRDPISLSVSLTSQYPRINL